MSSSHRSNKQCWSILATLLVVSLSLAACGSPSSTSSTTTSTSSASLVARGLAYYKGKTITFIAPDSPGGGFSQYSFDYAPYLASYLHAKVNVTSVPAGNTVDGQNEVARSTPNGLTVGWLNAGPDIEDDILGITGVTFYPPDETVLGGSAPTVDAIAALKSPACAKWTSWSKVVKDSTVANPVNEVIQTTGTTTLALLLANGIFGVHAKTIPGYPSSSSLLQGFERGDGCVLVDPSSTIGPLVKGGRASALLLSVPVQKSSGYYSVFKNTPSFGEVEKENESSLTTSLQKSGETVLNEIADSARGFFAAKGTPADEAAALEAAFKSVSNNQKLESELVKQGNPTGYQTPATVIEDYKTFVAAAKKITAYLGPIKSTG